MISNLDLRRIFGIPFIYDAFQNFIGANSLKKMMIQLHIDPCCNARILEIGCGPGKNIEYLPHSIEYVGCDQSSKYIQSAKRNYGEIGQFHCMSVADINKIDDHKFDIILSIGVLHHLSDELILELCQEMKGVLKEGGYFLALEPCWTETQSWINRKIMSYDRGEYIRNINQYCKLLDICFKQCEGKEIQTRGVIIYPTSACVIKAFI